MASAWDPLRLPPGLSARLSVSGFLPPREDGPLKGTDDSGAAAMECNDPLYSSFPAPAPAPSPASVNLRLPDPSNLLESACGVPWGVPPGVPGGVPWAVLVLGSFRFHSPNTGVVTALCTPRNPAQQHRTYPHHAEPQHREPQHREPQRTRGCHRTLHPRKSHIATEDTEARSNEHMPSGVIHRRAIDSRVLAKRTATTRCKADSC